MIKGIIFDLDGVLVDTKKIHFNALNMALKENKINYQISLEDHLKVFDGLPSKEKLFILNNYKRIKKKLNKKILLSKKKITKKLIAKEIKFNKKMYDLFYNLSKKYTLIVATNAIRKTLDMCIKKLKISKFITYSISNEEVKNPKPHPEIYMKSMLKFGLIPFETLILEDSYIGRESAKNSGANLMPIRNISDVNLKNINASIKKIESTKKNYTKNQSWEDDKLNILIPMAGLGSRFKAEGYTFPKPLIEIHGKPMIQWVVENLNIKANYIFLVQKEHQQKYNIKSVLKILVPNCKIIVIESLTEGAACTTLLAKKFINNKNQLLICNSDQFVEWNVAKVMYKFSSKKIDGGILVFNSIHPKWSYAKTDNRNIVSEVAEKKVISNKATVGIYYWSKGSDYVKYAEQMINKNIRVNNEFYVCPVYNEAINDKKIILTENIDQMWGLGTPEDLNYFIQNY